MERGNGGLHLEIEVNREHKIVSVWLCKSDRESVAVHTVLKQMHEKCKKHGYTMAQFHAGEENCTLLFAVAYFVSKVNRTV